MQIQKKENIFSGHYKLNKVFLYNERNGELFDREQFATPNSIGVLVFDVKKEEIILVQQFRVGPEKELLEVVAGKLEIKDNDIASTLKREVLEEVGYEVDHFQLIHEFHPCPGPVTEKMSLFYAEVSQQVEAGGGLEEENEEIEVVRLSIDDFLAVQFNDAKSIIAQQWFKINKMD